MLHEYRLQPTRHRKLAPARPHRPGSQRQPPAASYQQPAASSQQPQPYSPDDSCPSWITLARDHPPRRSALTMFV